VGICCVASIRLTKGKWCISSRSYARKGDCTYCRAARIIRALRSRRLASRLSAVSSHTARPPASCSGEGATSVTDSLLSSPKREINVSLDPIWGATAVAVRAAVGAPAGSVPFALDGRG
jgi:hypothetical protein